ncbi:putative G-protein coupled receptor 148 [Brachyhypopomus gauderio]|uniref:putative G-protein coupled receptor 148 n=1 Tax=Brachyhypopomus gauderio TaxID=698409 RepID=UPI0040436705
MTTMHEVNCSCVNTTTVNNVMVQTQAMNFLLIPAVVLTAITLLADPPLLVCVLRHRRLREEARYVFLANVFLSDILFLTFNLANVSCNALAVETPAALCGFFMVSTVTTCCSTVLTLTLMVVDTFVAVRWPLRYAHILPRRRARAVVGAVWLVSASFPLAMLLVMDDVPTSTPRTLCLVLGVLGVLKRKINISLHVYFSVWVFFCSVLICCCYMRLYVVTRSSGIWSRRFSRARLTLLLHALVLLVYFVPCFVFTAQLALYDVLEAGLTSWLNGVNLTVLVLLPRASAPYLYGLRYRELYYALRLSLGRRHPVHVSDRSAAGQGSE